ncbi:cadherin-23-like [Argiope bruennichi]|uniref:cadherin-23-like n=1 Tax=Argiope bruennichi TaxID=94029 RepID=UPI00249502C6|nr:cadherin-23-like [Argiope bruennichi]
MSNNGFISKDVVIANIMKYISLVFVISSLLATKCSGQINRPPEFVKGGDMDKFSLNEDTPVGSSVYTLRARDPENTRVHYYISGDSLSVERDTGVVKLIRPLDREVESSVEVIISITDESVAGLQPNTISIRREILILDQNDNPPKFQNAPYIISVDETTTPGTTIYKDIIVTDADIGANAEMKLSCLSELTPLACQKFEIRSVAISAGRIRGEIVLTEAVDYEEQTSYTMSIQAEDLSEFRKMKSTTSILININDIQDQPPLFQNAPFTATVLENSVKGTSVLNLVVRDGDSGDPRELLLLIENDDNGYFRLGEISQDDRKVFTTTLQTNNPIDRENEEILDNGGLYMFRVKAIELVDGLPVGESTTSNVTIVVGDVNDQAPLFNEREFNVTIPEDIGTNTPLPGLNLVVTDMDVGDNAKFELVLEDMLNSEGMFAVFPSVAIGRTPVIIRVINANELDYEKPEKRLFIFKVKTIQEGFASDSAVVTVTLTDANDNAPMFEKDQYTLHVPENVAPGTSVFILPARDKDSSAFGKVTYSLKGFGSDKFEVIPDTGEIIVSDCGQITCLDYEAQKSYSLTYEAMDGGGRVTAVNLFMEVTDTNDNAPQFAKDIYTHEVLENTEKILPPLFIKATDSDGPSQGNGKVTYSIMSSELADPTAITIDPESGEVSLTRPLKHSETPAGIGLLNIIIRATDHGEPPLSSTAKLVLKVKKENDGAPEFSNLPYRVSVKENAKGGTSVLRIVATDPDGPDSDISYFIHNGAKDNFVLDQKSGLIAVASGADLDRDVYGLDYSIIVHAVDAGNPVQQTATATVSISVEDVNNKPPKFSEDSYVKYISESANIGDEVLSVIATDPDENAKLRYSIVEPIVARDKTGSVVTSSAYNYKNAFRIDGTTGKIIVNQPLEYNSASVIILTVEAVDLNAVDITFGREQKTSVEVTIYIRAHGEMNPVFSPPWTQAHPAIEITVPEETMIGSTLLTLSAWDPLTHTVVNHFEKISGSDPDNYVSVSPVSGVVALNRRLDFEALPSKHISFKVKAIIGEAKNQRSSEASVIINVQDINDNSPVFSQNSYTTSISESAEYPESILTVLASDKDSQDGFGTIRYSISGDGSDVFDIDETSGTISIRENATLDRERQATYNLQITATDNPRGLANQRRTSIIVVIKILDENDNAPKFNQEIYTAVIPENVPTDFSIVTVKATDVDSGANGEVTYKLQEDGENQPMNFFAVDTETGVVSVIRALSGKGRSDPYTVIIEARDKGNPPLSSICHLLVVIGDISTNDGVPQFIRPTAGEVAYIHENVTVRTQVFQVVAFDPDNSNTANGKVAYKLLDDERSEDSDYEFVIDAATGVITTQAPLDRERKENYTMIVVAHDFGFPPQEAHRVLRIFVLDVDDSEPQFQRPLKSQPIEIVLKEEEPIGTIAGVLKAVDNDTGVNSIIDYYILNGNDDDVFSIRRSSNNEGELMVQKRIDREKVDKFTLTIKVSKPSEPVTEFGEPYNYQDLSQTQVTILVEDIDDNPPTFENSNYVLGARGNTDVDTELITLHAFDPDVSSSPMTYSIKSMTFIRPSTDENVGLDAFHINSETGVINNNEPLGKYVGGHFDITVEARSSPDARFVAHANVKIYILQDRDLLKFVFYKRPNEVREIIPDFEKALKEAVAQPISLNIYDTNFYARNDGSLDFESTSSCFQLLENDVIIEPKKVMKILNKAKSPSVRELYSNYSLVAIESCASSREAYRMLWSEIVVLFIAALMAFVSFILCILICTMYSNYKKKLKRMSYFHSVYLTENGGHPPILSPAEQQRIYEWQEMNAPLADAASFRSYPTLR